MSDNKHDIFISYSRKDSEIVYQVVQKLESAGFSIWIDKNGVESGDAFKGVIVKAIENCRAVVFFSSITANSSPWITKEISVAIYEKKRIIPVHLDDCKYNSEIKFDLINLDYIEMTDPQQIEDGTQRLIRSLGNIKSPIYTNIAATDKVAAIEKPSKSTLFIKANYKSCTLTLTLCLIGLIAIPFVIRMFNSGSSGTTDATSTPDDYEMYVEVPLPVTFSKEGFIMDVNIPDYAYAVEVPAADSAVVAESYYPEPTIDEDPAYKCMFKGIEYIESKDYINAYDQFKQAAELGNPDAMYNLAISHLTGLGADIDTIQAEKWLVEASQNYNEAAKKKLEELNKGN